MCQTGKPEKRFLLAKILFKKFLIFGHNSPHYPYLSHTNTLAEDKLAETYFLPKMFLTFLHCGLLLGSMAKKCPKLPEYLNTSRCHKCNGIKYSKFL